MVRDESGIWTLIGIVSTGDYCSNRENLFAMIMSGNGDDKSWVCFTMTLIGIVSTGHYCGGRDDGFVMIMTMAMVRETCWKGFYDDYEDGDNKSWVGLTMRVLSGLYKILCQQVNMMEVMMI